MAFSMTVGWDVRTTGNDANGGGFDPVSGTPGTDYSIFDAPQVVYTDLAIDAATDTKCTSTLNPFTAAHVGNVVNVTGGTGFAAQRVQVMSVTAGVATVDKSLGTLGSVGGAGKLGGGLATIGAANALCVEGNVVHIKAGTYTHTAAVVIALSTVTWRGYQTAHGDGGTKPLITTASDDTDLIHTVLGASGAQAFENLKFTNTATVRANGILQLSAHSSAWYLIKNCDFDGFTSAINNDDVGAHYDVYWVSVIGCEIKNCSSYGITDRTGILVVQGCNIHHCSVGIDCTSGVPSCNIDHCLITDNTSHGINLSSAYTCISSCTVANNGGYGIWGSTGQAIVALWNNIFYGNSYGVFFSGAAVVNAYSPAVNNAFKNTNSNQHWDLRATDISLSVDPFTNAAGGDYSLNSAAGGGAECKDNGYPGVFPGGLSAGVVGIGAVQAVASISPGGGSGGAFTFIG